MAPGSVSVWVKRQETMGRIIMQISARNQLKGKVKGVNSGMVMCEVTIEVMGPCTMTAEISKVSCERLGLKEGSEVTAIVKATDVMVGSFMLTDNPPD